VFAAQTHGPPFELKAHGTTVVVDLRHVANDLRVDFCAHGFGEVGGELGVFDLSERGSSYAKSGLFVEFWGILALLGGYIGF
jgi:hypothetical protein